MTVTLGNPAPLGLICFGMTTMMLMYVEMGWVEVDFEVQIAGLALTLGGFGQVLVAIFEIIKGSSFSFAVFGAYGCFWLTFAVVYIYKSDINSTFGEAKYTDGMTFYLAQWGVLTFCFWIVTLRKNLALIVIFTLLTITFFLLATATHTASHNVRLAAGYFGFFTAVGALYTGAAELINEEYGRHICPGLRPIHAPQRLVLSPEVVASLIHYDEKTKTLLLQFRGLQIRTAQDVETIRDQVEKAILASKEDKVHVVADYDNTYIGDDIASLYWTMAAETERKYYLSATRFHVSSFGTRTQSAAVSRMNYAHPVPTAIRTTMTETMVMEKAVVVPE
jgi:uncharacterized protein